MKKSKSKGTEKKKKEKSKNLKSKTHWKSHLSEGSAIPFPLHRSRVSASTLGSPPPWAVAWAVILAVWTCLLRLRDSPAHSVCHLKGLWQGWTSRRHVKGATQMCPRSYTSACSLIVKASGVVSAHTVLKPTHGPGPNSSESELTHWHLCLSSLLSHAIVTAHLRYALSYLRRPNTSTRVATGLCGRNPE